MGKWIEENTAILVIHGIGNQKPLETLDMFARGLLDTFGDKYECDELKLTHCIEPKPRSSGGTWHDNFIRIKNGKDSAHLDIYEYYWANMTEDKVSSKDVKKWVIGVKKGAMKFFRDNEEMALRHEKGSWFVKKEKFRKWRYYVFVSLASSLYPTLQKIKTWILALLGAITPIPVLRSYLQEKWKESSENLEANFNNVIGDVVVYNTIDAKSKFYQTRKAIRDGAVKAVSHLITPDKKDNSYQLKYDSVFVAGHSLGSQVSYDLVNRINHHVSMGEVEGYTKDGTLKKTDDANTSIRISEVLKGLVTFGSPLDKIKYFLRESVPHEHYIRLQMLDNFHSFRKKDVISEAAKSKMKYEFGSPYNSLFEEIPWLNFYDKKDYVSGALDYYSKVTNIDCTFKGKNPFRFTHSWYWNYDPMYQRIIKELLIK